MTTLLLLALTLTPYQKGVKDGACNSYCVNELNQDYGSYSIKNKKCACILFVDESDLIAPKITIQLKTENDSQYKYDWDY